MDSAYLVFYALIFLWLVHISQRIFYCFYFWQLKEYRISRIKGDPARAWNVFFPKASFLMLILLLIPPALLDYSWWGSAVMAAFYLLGLYSVYLLLMKRWRFPKFTKKAILLLLLAFVALSVSLFLFNQYFLIFIAVLELVLPFVAFLIMELVQIPTNLWKKMIYGKAMKKIKKREKLIVVGITGSFGKSSTKEFLYTMLSRKYNVLKTSGNINTEIGVAQTVINNLKPEHQVFIVEMGAYRKGEIKLLCDIVKPKIGVVTGVNEQHLALFGSMENLLFAEGGRELASALPQSGLLVLNGDNKHCLDLSRRTNLPAGLKKMIYSLKGDRVDSDLWTEDISVHKEYVSFLVVDKNRNAVHLRANVLGKQNVQNILAAILVARELGVSLEEIVEACKDMQQDQAGMRLKKGKHNIDIIDSSYSANPDGVLADLDYLNTFPGKKVVVMPCLIELGKQSSSVHEKIGRKIGEVCDMAIITSKDNFRDIKKGILEAGKKPESVVLCDRTDDIYSMLTLYCKSGDAVLLEGRVPGRLLKLLAD